jgi:hypothetical protein
MFELVRALAYLVAAKLTVNPHTQNRRMRHPNSRACRPLFCKRAGLLRSAANDW